MLQVLLVPSMGASLSSGEVPGVDGALMFNVDANTGSAAGKRMGAEPYSCPCHPAQKSSRRLTCSVPQHYKCWGMSKWKTCPHCASRMDKSIENTSYKVCPEANYEYNTGPVNCPVCLQPTERQGRCATHGWKFPAPLDKCPVCSVVMTSFWSWCHQQHEVTAPITPCPQHPAAVLSGDHKCPQTLHTYPVTQTVCPGCAAPLTPWGKCATHGFMALTVSGNCPTCNGSRRSKMRLATRFTRSLNRHR